MIGTKEDRKITHKSELEKVAAEIENYSEAMPCLGDIHVPAEKLRVLARKIRQIANA